MLEIEYMREVCLYKQIDYYELEGISDYLQISLHPSCLLKELSMPRTPHPPPKKKLANESRKRWAIFIPTLN